MVREIEEIFYQWTLMETLWWVYTKLLYNKDIISISNARTAYQWIISSCAKAFQLFTDALKKGNLKPWYTFGTHGFCDALVNFNDRDISRVENWCCFDKDRYVGFQFRIVTFVNFFEKFLCYHPKKGILIFAKVPKLQYLTQYLESYDGFWTFCKFCTQLEISSESLISVGRNFSTVTLGIIWESFKVLYVGFSFEVQSVKSL